MNKSSARQFRLADAMFLLAATAVGLFLTRRNFFDSFWAERISVALSGGTRPILFRDRLFSFIAGSSCLLFCWSLATLGLSMRSPRSRRFRLFCQPGMLAIATTAAYAITVAIGFLLALIIRHTYKPEWSDYIGQAIDTYGTAKAIMAAWIVLAFSGRWRPEPSWTDRLGRLIGFSWIALIVVGNISDWW